MSMWGERDSENAIVRVQGAPLHPNRPHERSRWRCFVEWVCPWLRKGGDLAQDYGDAKAAQEHNKAAKVAEEAAEIASRTDQQRQHAAREFNAVVDDIFKRDGLPDEAKALKLAKLLESNPHLLEQTEKVKRLLDHLHLNKGLSVQAVTDEDEMTLKALPADETGRAEP